MFDKELREPVQAEPMMVVTLREVIEGNIYHNLNVRLSDALNSEAHQHSRYVALKDATVYSIATRRQILKTGFLLISHSQIIYMTPKNAVAAADTTAAPPPAIEAAAEAATKAERAAIEQTAAATAADQRTHAHSYHELLDMLTEMRTHGPAEKRSAAV